MALPTEPLKILDTDEIELDELEALTEKFKISTFKAFMAKHSNWTAEQVGKLNVKEMRSTMEAVSKAIFDSAIPKEI